jgi:hypothetical protein
LQQAALKKGAVNERKRDTALEKLQKADERRLEKKSATNSKVE